MAGVKEEGILLEKGDVDFEMMGVLNAAVIMVDNVIHLFYRTVARNNLSRIGDYILSDPLTIKERCAHPIFSPEHEYDKNGIEDSYSRNRETLPSYLHRVRWCPRSRWTRHLDGFTTTL